MHVSKQQTASTKLNQQKSDKKFAYAVKSAEPDAARKALVSRQQLHTAPLCPSNVPIQSPVSPFLSIGLESETITQS